MSFEKKDNLPTRTGGSIGHSNENRLIENAGGPNTIVTRIRKYADGTTTRLKTRAGFPEFVTTKKSAPVATTRTFVFRHIDAATGVIANKFGSAMKILDDAFDFVGDVTYWVGLLVTDNQGFWKDVFRRDGSAIKKNGAAPTPVIATVSVGGTRSIPAVVSSSGYAGLCVGDADRSTLFIVDEEAKQIISTKPDGTQKSFLTASGSTTYNDAGIAGRCVSTDSADSVIDVVFASCHRPRVNPYLPSDPLYNQASMVRYVWEKLRITLTTPYIVSVSYDVEDATTFISMTHSADTSSGFTGGNIPSSLNAAVRRELWQVLPGGAVGYVFDSYAPFTSSRTEFSTFETSRTYNPSSVEYMQGSGFGVTVLGSCSGTNTASGGAGRKFMTYNSEPEFNVYAGHAATTNFNMTSRVQVISESAGHLFDRTDTCVANASNIEETVRVNLPYVETVPPPSGSEFVSIVEDYIAPWEYQSTYENNPVQSAKTGTINMFGIDYAFFDPIEQIGVGIMCEVTCTYSVEGYPDGTLFNLVTSGHIKVKRLVHIRGSNHTDTYWEGPYPTLSAAPPSTLNPAWPNPFAGFGALATPSIGTVDYSACFVSGYQVNSLGDLAYFTKHPVFSPTYTSQSYCKHVGYTTKAEEAAGATREVYVDMKVSPKRPMDFTLLVPEPLGGGIPFVAGHVCHALFGLSSSMGQCYTLWNSIFPQYQPVTVQFANGEFGNWQSKLGPGFTGNPPLEITRI